MSVQARGSECSWLQRQLVKWKRDVAFVLCQARTLTFILKHPQTPWPARLVAGSAAAYVLSPIQLIPTFIPVIGQMDDLFVLFVGMKFLRKMTPKRILDECETRARSSAFVQRHAAEAVPLERKESSLPAA
jgi:uncharacterized membrane protein YkvA (DUF1232 family)